jgi:DNA-binding LytR/AlgR family response regulator
MSTVLIADDEPKLAQDLARRLKRLWHGNDIVAVVDNGSQAAAAMARLSPQFAFLDIRMPGMSGLEVAATAADTRIVFVTAHDEYAVAAFDAAAVDYLLKPVSDTRLAQCVLKLQQTAAPRADLTMLLGKLDRPSDRPSDRYLAWLHTGAGNTTRVLSVAETLYFRAADKYTDVVTASERHVIRLTLKELLEQLDPQQFVQIHRSIIVNLNAVARVERDMLGRSEIHLKNHQDVLPVSRAFAGTFKRM